MIAIIGSEGSMGKRYQAIARYLKQEFKCFDKTQMPQDKILEGAAACDRIMICTPTHTHTEYLRELLPTRKPILCEKPVCKDMEELEELHAFCARGGYQYQMVMQYKELCHVALPGGFSHYNYFRHGADGLYWDCMQIIGLAEGPVTLKEDSPVWDCAINGVQLSLADMDKAYVRHIRKWVEGRLEQSMDDILHVHRKVDQFIKDRE